jgi:hypothetical protein
VKNVMSVSKTGRNPTKKRSPLGADEHVDEDFNAVLPSQWLFKSLIGAIIEN